MLQKSCRLKQNPPPPPQSKQKQTTNIADNSALHEIIAVVNYAYAMHHTYKTHIMHYVHVLSIRIEYLGTIFLKARYFGILFMKLCFKLINNH
jgi:hypothetical protein